jgi:hypothetical protein
VPRINEARAVRALVGMLTEIAASVPALDARQRRAMSLTLRKFAQFAKGDLSRIAQR